MRPPVLNLTKDAVIRAWARVIYFIALVFMLGIIAAASGAGIYIVKVLFDKKEVPLPERLPVTYRDGSSKTIYQTENLDALIDDANRTLSGARSRLTR